MSQELKLVYTGSKVESLWLEELLNEKNIGCFRNDSLESSLNAGWVDGSAEDSSRIFVEEHNYKDAKRFLEEYFASLKDKQENDKE